jgi:hypothetical protein
MPCVQALIFHEVRRRMGTNLDMAIGDALDFDTLEAHLPPKNLARHLQNHVYDLSRFLSRSM